MKAEIVKNIIVKLELTSEESDWLRAIMQNPINVKFPQDENEKDKIMREAFFYALSFE